MVLLLACFICVNGFSQLEFVPDFVDRQNTDSLLQNPPCIYDPTCFDLEKTEITYYEFLDNIQMIRISNRPVWNAYLSTLFLPPISSIRPIEVPPEDVLVFRDSSGRILNQYCACENTFKADDFLSIAAMGSIDLIKHETDKYPIYEIDEVRMSYYSIFGLINSHGKQIAAIEYAHIKELKDGSFALLKGDFWELYNANYERIVPFVIKSKYTYEIKKINHIKQNGKWGICDENLTILLPCEYDYQIQYSPTLSVHITKNGKNGLLTPNFKVILPLDFNYIGHFNKGYAKVGYKSKYGFIDTLGNIVTPLIYNNISPFYEGFANVRIDSKYGFIDSTRQVVIPLKYESAELFSFGLAAVKKKNKWGYINTKGEVVIKFQYYSADRFNTSTRKARVWLKPLDKGTPIEIDLPSGY